MSGIITAFVAIYQGLPYWMIPIVAIVAGVVVTILLALIFKTFTAKKHEEMRLNNLPRLVLDIHKQICKVRGHLVKHTDWDNVDTSKVLIPMFDAAFSAEGEQSAEANVVDTITSNLNEIGKLMHGAPSVLNTYMREGDTSLENKLQRNLWYRVLMARLDNHKPYPSDAIRKSIQLLLDSSISFNNVILWLLYKFEKTTPESISYATGVSGVKAHQIYTTNKNIEKIMDATIDEANTKLQVQVDNYLTLRKKK